MWVRLDRIGQSVLWSPDPGLRVSRIGALVLWNDVGELHLDRIGVLVIWSDVPLEQPGRRTFPVPQDETIWQSQSGKRTFPLIGQQES
jgi:hypothetical protein